MKIPSFMAALAVATTFSGIQAKAESFGVHFLGTTTDNVTGTAGVVPIGGWNNIANQTFNSGSVTSSDGLVTAGLTIAGTGAHNGWRSVGTPPNTGGNASLMDGYMDLGTSQTATISLTGLTGSLYDVYIYTIGDAPRPGNNGDYLPAYGVNGTNLFTATLGGAFTSFTQGGTQTTNSNVYPTSLTYGNYILFSNVAPVGGAITITGGNAQTWRSPLNGFEVVSAVPEPSSVALGFVGLMAGIVIVRIRRRRLAAA